MTIKSIALTAFMPPDTQWPAPVMPMPDIEPATCLCYCADGALLSVLLLDANEVLTRIPKDVLTAQCLAIKERSPWAYLVIVGDLVATKDGYTKADGQARKWHWHAVQGALLSIQEMGVSILHIESEAEFGPLLARLAKRDRATKRALASRGWEPMSIGEDLLMSLPDIGERLALQVLHDAGTPIWALIALCDPTANVPGVGDKIRNGVRQALGLLPDQNITLIQPGDVIVPASLQEQAA